MKVYVDSVGCRLNQSEIEKIATQFRLAGHDLVSSFGEADLVVVNTCAVTADAAADSRQRIRQAGRGEHANVIATGCWATLDSGAAASLPRVSHVISNQEKDNLVATVLGLPIQSFDLEPLARVPLPGAHQRTRAFIKVQDGCDHFCTFCITRVARGTSRSRSEAEIISDIQSALAGHTREIVLSGVQLGSWGKDLTPSQTLKDLIRTILGRCDVERLRLSSLEPWDLGDDFFSLWQDKRLCPHLHLPLQSGSGSVSRRMARKSSPEEYAAIVQLARRSCPGIAITTDIMVGFPGESETDFQESLDFIKEINFAGGHVFSYSPRPGTPAARYANQVPPPIKKIRGSLVREVLAISAKEYQHGYIGKTLDVLWEASEPTKTPAGNQWLLTGLTGNYIKISALSGERIWNRVSPVKVLDKSQDGLTGDILLEAQLF